MEYRVEKLLDGLTEQRLIIVQELCGLNENLPNYLIKCTELNNQIANIDNQISNFVLSLKDIEMQGLNNKITIEQLKTSKVE